MEYGGGNSLDQFIRSKSEGRLKENEACKIFTQVLRAVAYCEKMNVVHRDLKPENILLNKHLEVKIIDFGFSLISK
jgi:serine/threonine protein kinase